ncbi:MAG: hypothetical protein WC843_02865 [Candidatus Gracilibacteria bacterium]|jgi:hypothetical protein
MPETLLTLQEAAKISGKSLQTIRRALKGKKLQAKKKRTPQGFNYLITQESLVKFYKLGQSSIFDREQRSIKEESKAVSAEVATLQDLQKLQAHVEGLLEGNKKDKESFMRFMKAFQDRFLSLENQFKLLEQPKRKWYQVWK